MKFREVDIDSSKKTKRKSSQKSTPFKIKVVEVEENKTETVVNEKQDVVPKKQRSFKQKINKKTKEAKKSTVKPNINLLVTDDDFENFNDKHSDGDFSDNEGDYEAFMEDMAKIDGKKKKILSNRVEGSTEVSGYDMSSGSSTKVDTSDLVTALEANDEDVRYNSCDILTN